MDGESIDVKIIGQNSLYLFYIVEDSSSIIIYPIESNVKKIKKQWLNKDHFLLEKYLKSYSLRNHFCIISSFSQTVKR